MTAHSRPKVQTVVYATRTCIFLLQNGIARNRPLHLRDLTDLSSEGKNITLLDFAIVIAASLIANRQEVSDFVESGDLDCPRTAI